MTPKSQHSDLRVDEIPFRMTARWPISDIYCRYTNMYLYIYAIQRQWCSFFAFYLCKRRLLFFPCFLSLSSQSYFFLLPASFMHHLSAALLSPLHQLLLWGFIFPPPRLHFLPSSCPFCFLSFPHAWLHMHVHLNTQSMPTSEND